MFVKSVLLIVYVLGASPAEDSTSVFVTTWMVPSTLLFQLSCSSIKMLNGERMFATGRSRPMIVLLADFSPDDGRVQRRCVRVYSQAQQ